MGGTIKIQRSDKPEKKYVAVIKDSDTGRVKRVYFGQAGASDFTKHGQEERKQRYLDRHRDREDWTSSGFKTAGWWSRWILWNKKTIEASKASARSHLPSGWSLA